MRVAAVALVVALVLSVLPAAAFDDVGRIPSCELCGMSRDKFASTRMLIEYESGATTGVCSIHCLAVEMARSKDRPVRTIMAADYATGRLIDAEEALWVVGADIPGVMSKVSRLAFAEKGKALSFQKRKGGRMATFDEALDDTYGEMGSDVDALPEKRGRAGKGE